MYSMLIAPVSPTWKTPLEKLGKDGLPLISRIDTDSVPCKSGSSVVKDWLPLISRIGTDSVPCKSVSSVVKDKEFISGVCSKITVVVAESEEARGSARISSSSESDWIEEEVSKLDSVASTVSESDTVEVSSGDSVGSDVSVEIEVDSVKFDVSESSPIDGEVSVETEVDSISLSGSSGKRMDDSVSSGIEVDSVGSTVVSSVKRA